MFERYTERARRVIFFARYEASQFGSHTIETEHLLLGLCREDKQVLDLVGQSISDIRKSVEDKLERQPKVPTAIDLPLSNECKRILAYAGEESERLNHRHIGTEHLLLGILRESACAAAELLKERGANVETLRETLAKKPPSELESWSSLAHPSSAARLTLHELVDRLPEESLEWARAVLERGQEQSEPRK